MGALTRSNRWTATCWFPFWGVGLLLVAFLINLSANSLIQGVTSALGFIEMGSIVLFDVVGVVAADAVDVNFSSADPGASVTGFLSATALGILAFKGFTTITNSGPELKDASRNLGRAIMISIGLCVVICALVGFAVTLSMRQKPSAIQPEPSKPMCGAIAAKNAIG